MKCWNCGAEMGDGTRFCAQCGADQQRAQSTGTPPQSGWQGTPPTGTPPRSGWQGTPPTGTPPRSGWQGTPPTGTPPQSGWQGTPPTGTPPQSGWQGTPPTGTPPQSGWQGTPPTGTPPQSGWQGTPPTGTPPQSGWQGTPPPAGPMGGSAGGNEMILKIFAGICAVLYGVAAVRGLFGVIRFVFQSLFGSAGIIALPFNIAAAMVHLFVCLVLVMFILKRTPQNSDGLLALLGIGGAGIVIVQFFLMVIRVLLHRYGFTAYLRTFALAAVGAIVVVGGMYAILRFLLGEFPLVGKSKDELLQEVRETLESLGKTVGEAAQGTKDRWDANQQARQAQQQQAAQQQWQAQQQPQWQGQSAQWQGQGAGQPGAYGQAAPPPPPQGYAVTRLKADRSLVAYVCLSLVTCGLYSWYFIYALARDVNIACAGDGKQTAGLVKFVLLTFLTCGIYAWIWYYNLGNRLAANAPRYGMNFQENGTTVLMWFLLGSLLCGVGVFVAWHILIKNANALCGAYNYQHGI